MNEKHPGEKKKETNLTNLLGVDISTAFLQQQLGAFGKL
jgi:hypothetical protein